MSVDAETFLQEVSDLKHLFGDKWTLAIMVALSEGPLRRTQILSTVNSYTLDEAWSEKPGVLHDSILARALKKMTGEGLLVHHYDGSVFPPKAHYELTPEAAEFFTLVRDVASWASRQADLVARARAYNRHDGAAAVVDKDDAELSMLG
jgi:DNA-binding HxlR family transcriptional regulator